MVDHPFHRGIYFAVSEFVVWKKEIEVTNFCRRQRTGNVRERRFYCYRDGFFQEKVPRKKSLKSQGSNKINASCPSQIICKEYPQGEVRVSFINGHHGHDKENLGHLQLTKDERAAIAGKLVSILTLAQNYS